MRWRLPVVAFTATLTVAGLAAQQPPAPTVTAQGVAPRTVEAAEAEGAKWPRNPPQAERPNWADAFGPRERRCVRAADHVTIRSGDFVAGPFQDRVVMMVYAGKLHWKIWWVPNQMPPLNGAAMTMRATKLDQPERTVTEHFGNIANEHSAEPFFPTFILFPEKGLWLVVVTAGNNWGCFIVEETLAA
jgi:hypothetical protein